jgi:G3E family GTPase
MNAPRLILVGGFLGAGKTTSLLALAKSYHEEGLRVGLITNDQAANLVDTGALRVRGLRVEEVAGACFCCKFDELAQAADRLRVEEKPDVLLAEPVGSCTDLMATVVAPLKALYSKSFRVAPYSVLIDPTRARQMVLEKGFGGFSSKVAYIFLKQLEEAQVICLNKVDKLAQDETEALLAVLANEFPKARLLPISAWTGEGLAPWRELLDQPADASLNIAEVDYDVYADGEAELGWLNLTLRAEGKQPFDADALVARLLGSMKDRLEASGAEIAHIKALFQTDAGTSLANHTGGPYPPRLAQRIGQPVRAGQLVLNARVHGSPDGLRSVAVGAIQRALTDVGAEGRIEESAHFRPGRPTPTHRFLPC